MWTLRRIRPAHQGRGDGHGRGRLGPELTCVRQLPSILLCGDHAARVGIKGGDMSHDADKIPKHYRVIESKHPKVVELHRQLADAAQAEGPLDATTAQLIQLAGAVGVRSEGAVHSHARRALEAGASEAEIRHAVILLTTTLGFPAVAAAMDWLNDLI
jgi:4-carboxymuconolactone decarboxylase